MEVTKIKRDLVREIDTQRQKIRTSNINKRNGDGSH